MPRRLLPSVLGLLLLGGCVYYNGMYNTKRLAGSARKAEREGRTFEANNLWGQVITRAESLVVRHPDSKYVDEALVLKGTALARLGQCPSAMVPLSRVSLLPSSSEAAEDALLALGRCQLELGDPAGADLAFEQILRSHDPARRREALLLHARALRLTGRFPDAVAALEGLAGPRASEERLLALAGAGRRQELLGIADSLLALGDTTRSWDSIVVAVGRQDPVAASALLDRLLQREGTPPATRTRWLIEDGLRLAAIDSARAEARLEQAARVGAGTPGALAARLQLVRRRLAAAETADLAPLGRTVDSIAAAAGAPAEARQLGGTIRRVRSAEDSSSARAPAADMHLFLAAEAARDSLEAPRIAAALFRRIADDWPESPYAPKALLAVQTVDTAWADAARRLIEQRYAGSPYLAFVRGEASVGYQELEDSLRAFSLGLSRQRPRVEQPAGRRRPTTGAPGEPRRRGLEP